MYAPCLLCESVVASFLLVTSRSPLHLASSCLCLDPCGQSRQLCGLHFLGLLDCGSLPVQRTGYSGCGLPTKGYPPDLHLHLCNLPLFFIDEAIDCHSDCLITSWNILLFHANVATAAHMESSEDRLGAFCVALSSSCVAACCCLVCQHYSCLWLLSCSP